MTLTSAQRSLLSDCLLEMGQLLVEAGAEISRVEDTLSRVSRAYGAVRTDVFVITSIISMTIEFPNGDALTETRRVQADGQPDFYRVEKLNALSYECCASPLPAEELRARLDAIAAGRKPLRQALAGSVLAAGAFAVFFGGTVWDGLASALFGACICLLQQYFGRTQLMTVARNLLISLIVGLAVGSVTALIPALNMDKILIGDIMLLIPGLAMTNALRNMLTGNTISGVVRLAESLMWAAALAGGIMVALTIVNFIR